MAGPVETSSRTTSIAAKHREAASFHSGISLTIERFEGAIDAEAILDELHTNDLYLALACIDGNPLAVQVLERDVMTPVRPSVERACRDGSVSPEDVMQWTREKLLVGSDGDPPKLAQYTGRGALLGWVRVVAVREALQDRRKSKRERARDDAALLEGGAPAEVGAELTLLRDRYAASFRTAVQQALRRLSSEQRSLLRFHTHDGLTIDELAPMLGVHRATAARRLEKARADALDHTRAILREAHGLSESEARSLCLVLGREVDVSIKRALSDEAMP
jgi:RNA polymerase sigma-70 factor, ECF subfamily